MRQRGVAAQPDRAEAAQTDLARCRSPASMPPWCRAPASTRQFAGLAARDAEAQPDASAHSRSTSRRARSFTLIVGASCRPRRETCKDQQAARRARRRRRPRRCRPRQAPCTAALRRHRRSGRLPVGRPVGPDEIRRQANCGTARRPPRQPPRRPRSARRRQHPAARTGHASGSKCRRSANRSSVAPGRGLISSRSKPSVAQQEIRAVESRASRTGRHQPALSRPHIDAACAAA